MKQKQWLFSSESVAPGQPDKACDQISDLIVDFFLERDPQAKVAAETMISDKVLAICGEFNAEESVIEEAKVVLPYKIKDLLLRLYPTPAAGFDWQNAKKTFELKRQSPDIYPGSGKAEMGAGDQGMVFGFACDETEEMMPLAISLSHRMMERQHKLFLEKKFPMGSDAKCQVTVKYEGDVPRSVEKVVFSVQHPAEVDVVVLRQFVMDEIIGHVIPSHLKSSSLECLINPTGRFVVGGPQGDTGLTGRKIMVDTYGGSAPHGGGAFSGKDPSKVDRSGAYMARMLAKAIVSAGLSTKCLVQMAYAIGISQPMSFMVDFQGTELTSFTEGTIERLITSKFDLSPAGMIAFLDLRRPIYLKTAVFGHFGRELPEFSWETSQMNVACQTIERLLSEIR